MHSSTNGKGVAPIYSHSKIIPSTMQRDLSKKLRKTKVAGHGNYGPHSVCLFLQRNDLLAK